MVNIEVVRGKKALKRFIDIPFQLYKGDPNWVPPLRGQLLKTLSGINNGLFSNGVQEFFIAWKDGKPVGRILTGINEKLNREKSKKEGYISLFESINDKEVSRALFDATCSWLSERGMDTVTGPVSPTGGDDSRGVLIKGFDGPPVLMNSYNPPYYEDLFLDYGFSKDMDLFAYYLSAENLDVDRYYRVTEYAMKKFKFRIDKFDPKQLDREIRDVKKILDVSMPETWEHLVPPSLEEIRAEFNTLVKFMDRDFVYIARSGDEPIGFIVALPDYNQVLRRLNGRLLPFGFLKYLWYRRKITGVRIFIQFVVPAFRNKAVINAIYCRLMLEGKRKGYTHAEGSTIAEMNKESIRNVEGAGGKLYRIYRIYRKSI